MDGRARERGGRRFHHPFLESVSVPVRPQSTRDLLHLSPVGLERATVKVGKVRWGLVRLRRTYSLQRRILDGAQEPLNRSSGADTSGS